ncbi:hypothetical protein HYX10_04325, partial [Candidatus Woesearchaeota archaeon]|nr:hypothetical protein [Candidatus Woesearchaeota archaeon]
DLAARRRAVSAVTSNGHKPHEVLTALRSAGLLEMYAPDVAAELILNGQSPLWRKSYYTGTGIFTGKTPAGAKVVAVVHRPHYLTNPDNIAEIIKAGVIIRTPEIPQDEFLRYLGEEDGKTIFVVDGKEWAEGVEGLVRIDYAMKDKGITAVLGGSDKAEQLLRIIGERYYGDKDLKVRVVDVSRPGLTSTPHGHLAGLGGNQILMVSNLHYPLVHFAAAPRQPAAQLEELAAQR